MIDGKIILGMIAGLLTITSIPLQNQNEVSLNNEQISSPVNQIELEPQDEPQEIEVETQDVYEKASEELSEKLQTLDEINDKQIYVKNYIMIMEEYSEYFGMPITIYDVFSEEEIYLMQRVIETETYQCSFDGKVHVATVIINRIEDGRFGKDVNEVVTKPNQFSYWRTEIDEDTVLALEYAYLFGSEVDDALYFQSGGERKTFCGRELKYYDSHHWFY